MLAAMSTFCPWDLAGILGVCRRKCRLERWALVIALARRRRVGARAGRGDHHDAAGPEGLVDGKPRPAVVVPVLLSVGQIGFAPLTLTAVENDGHGLTRELLLQVLINGLCLRISRAHQQ